MSVVDSDEIYQHLSFPLPYRVLFLIGLGVLGWATNLHGLDLCGVDAVAAMDLRADAKPVMPVHHSSAFNHSRAVALYHSAYRLFISYSLFCFLSWSFFRLLTHGGPSLVDSYGYIPVITALAIVIVLVLPHDILLRNERAKFTQ